MRYRRLSVFTVYSSKETVIEKNHNAQDAELSAGTVDASFTFPVTPPSFH
jgi:hypothetical protein